jgi:hypothetical protein
MFNAGLHGPLIRGGAKSRDGYRIPGKKNWLPDPPQSFAQFIGPFCSRP